MAINKKSFLDSIKKRLYTKSGEFASPVKMVKAYSGARKSKKALKKSRKQAVNKSMDYLPLNMYGNNVKKAESAIKKLVDKGDYKGVKEYLISQLKKYDNQTGSGFGETRLRKTPFRFKDK